MELVGEVDLPELTLRAIRRPWFDGWLRAEQVHPTAVHGSVAEVTFREPEGITSKKRPALRIPCAELSLQESADPDAQEVPSEAESVTLRGGVTSEIFAQPGDRPVGTLHTPEEEHLRGASILARRGRMVQLGISGMESWARFWASDDLVEKPGAVGSGSGFGCGSMPTWRMRCPAETPLLVRVGTDVVRVGSLHANSEVTVLDDPRQGPETYIALGGETYPFVRRVDAAQCELRGKER